VLLGCFLQGYSFAQFQRYPLVVDLPNNNKKQTTKIPIKHQAANQKNNLQQLKRAVW
jgi:hypothetical protein